MRLQNGSVVCNTGHQTGPCAPSPTTRRKANRRKLFGPSKGCPAACRGGMRELRIGHFLTPFFEPLCSILDKIAAPRGPPPRETDAPCAPAPHFLPLLPLPLPLPPLPSSISPQLYISQLAPQSCPSSRAPNLPRQSHIIRRDTNVQSRKAALAHVPSASATAALCSPTARRLKCLPSSSPSSSPASCLRLAALPPPPPPPTPSFSTPCSPTKLSSPERL